MEMTNEAKQAESKSAKYQNEKNQIKKLYSSGKLKILGFIQGNVLEYSCHKFSSNVIEKSLKQADKEQVGNIINEILSMPQSED